MVQAEQTVAFLATCLANTLKNIRLAGLSAFLLAKRLAIGSLRSENMSAALVVPFGRAARASTRALEAHHLHQRPQSRAAQQIPPAARRQRRTAFNRSDRWEPSVVQGRQSQQPSGVHRLQQTWNVSRNTASSAALGPRRVGNVNPASLSVQTGGQREPSSSAPPSAPGREAVQPVSEAAEPPGGSEQQAAPPEPEAEMKELAAAVNALAEAKKLLPSQALPPEAKEALTALQYLTLPQLDQHAEGERTQVVFAELFTPGDKQVRLKQVAASVVRYVAQNSRVVIWEVQAAPSPVASFLPGSQHLRLGFTPLQGGKTPDSQSVLIAAAEDGARRADTAVKILQSFLKRGFPDAAAASRQTALLFPTFVAEIPRFGQPFAWVGKRVFATLATLSPAFSCSVKELLTQTAAGLAAATEEATTPPLAAVQPLPPLSVAAREFIALRLLTSVYNLHALDFVHDALSLQAVVLTAEGNVFLSNLESASFVSPDESCQASSPPSSSKPATSLQAQPLSSSSESPAAPAASPADFQKPIGQEDKEAACLLGPEKTLANESVMLGMLLFQVLANGRLPFGLTTGAAAAEALLAMQQGVFRPAEGLPGAAVELKNLGVSQKWQACVEALLGTNGKQTVTQAAPAYFPEFISPNRPKTDGEAAE
ncbi:hypothetical protein Efla_007612 [Eimeria flavescens]